MRITKQTDYSLRILLYLASRPGQRVSSKQIAEAHNISLNHLHKIVSVLGELGFLQVFRGAYGGLELQQDLKTVSIGAVMRAIDDKSSLVECFNEETNTCVISPACALKGALKQAQEAFYQSLDPLTLADVVKGGKAARLRALTSDA
ncbi:MAG: Rrf2 family nitric oxide-sensitive transcriptional repressor [Planctomycetota bacterium]|jgi:Rrf2 family nitric oxide-sensitive transcriptional repressor